MLCVLSGAVGDQLRVQRFDQSYSKVKSYSSAMNRSNSVWKRSTGLSDWEDLMSGAKKA